MTNKPDKKDDDVGGAAAPDLGALPEDQVRLRCLEAACRAFPHQTVETLIKRTREFVGYVQGDA